MTSPVMKITTRGARSGQALADAVEEPHPVELARHAGGRSAPRRRACARCTRAPRRSPSPCPPRSRGARARVVTTSRTTCSSSTTSTLRSRRPGASTRSRGSACGVGSSAARGHAGQADRERGAAPGLGLDGDRAAVVRHDAEDEAEAEARAVLARREERVEHPPDVAGAGCPAPCPRRGRRSRRRSQRVENVTRRSGVPASVMASRALLAEVDEHLLPARARRAAAAGTRASKSRTISTLSIRNWYSFSEMTDSMTSLRLAGWRSLRDWRAKVSRFSTIFLHRRALLSMRSMSRRGHCSTGSGAGTAARSRGCPRAGC